MDRFINYLVGAICLLGFVWVSYSQSIKGVSTQGTTLNGVTFNPTSLGNLFAWFKAGEGVTLTAGKVSTWQDQTTNAFSVVQVTSAQRPLHITNSLNGLFTIRTSQGGNTGMYATNTHPLLRGLVSGTRVPYSIIVVANCITNGAGNLVAWGSNTNASDSFKLRGAGVGATFPYQITDETSAAVAETDLIPSLIKTNVWTIFAYSYNGNTNGLQAVYTNNMQTVFMTNQIHGATENVHSTDTFGVGGFYRSGGSSNSSFVDTDFAEILIYNRMLSSNEFYQVIYSYLRPKYGLQ